MKSGTGLKVSGIWFAVYMSVWYLCIHILFEVADYATDRHIYELTVCGLLAGLLALTMGAKGGVYLLGLSKHRAALFACHVLDGIVLVMSGIAIGMYFQGVVFLPK